MTLIPPESKIQPWLVGYGHARTAPLIIPAMAAQRPGTLADEQEQGTDRLNAVQGWVTKSPRVTVRAPSNHALPCLHHKYTMITD